MGWDVYYQRARATGAVIDRARRTNCYDLAPQRHPEIPAVFGTTEEFLAALRYKWSLLLMGYVDQTQHELDDVSFAEARRIATQACLAAHPTLWKLLETNTPPSGVEDGCVGGSHSGSAKPETGDDGSTDGGTSVQCSGVVRPV